MRVRSCMAILACVCVLTVAGCSAPAAPEGKPTTAAAATDFLVAVAAGDVARASAVSVGPVSDSDLSLLRLKVFGQTDPFEVTSVRLVGGYQVVQGSDPAKYLILDSYVAADVERLPDVDAADTYQIAVENRGGLWGVVGWTGSNEWRHL